jgi:hypothetical protein
MLYYVCNLDLQEEPVQHTSLLYLRRRAGRAVCSNVHSPERRVRKSHSSFYVAIRKWEVDGAALGLTRQIMKSYS